MGFPVHDPEMGGDGVLLVIGKGENTSCHPERVAHADVERDMISQKIIFEEGSVEAGVMGDKWGPSRQGISEEGKEGGEDHRA